MIIVSGTNGFGLFFALMLLVLGGCRQEQNDPIQSTVEPTPAQIQPYSQNPYYWQYEGRPGLLFGGSVDDNLFQLPEASLTRELDLLVESGGNYVRNTMSSRDEGNVQPFLKRGTQYDLTQWNEEYWSRFERFLDETRKRDVIVQIELWDQWDVLKEHWTASPWNPQKNVNYRVPDVKLHGDYAGVHHQNDVPHDFFLTVPDVQNDSVLLDYQRRFVDKVLEHSLAYDHVLYTVTNELFEQHPAEWSRYWGRYLARRAEQEGARVYVTEMFQGSDLESRQHRASLDDPNLFDYVELSQNSRQRGQAHWEKLNWVRSYIAHRPRPMNHVKTYGGAIEWTDGADEAIDRFWRSVIGGAASIRFHRPEAGIGLTERAQAHLRSARLFTEAFPLPSAQPDSRSRGLLDRDENEAYLTVVADTHYAVYFPNGGDLHLDLRGTEGPFRVRWLNLEASTWGDATEQPGEQRLRLTTPGTGDWIGLVQKQ